MQTVSCHPSGFDGSNVALCGAGEVKDRKIARESRFMDDCHVKGLPGGKRRRRRYSSGGEMSVSVQRVCPALRQGIAAIISVRFSLVPAS
jgi:hypothetical protein